MWFESQNCAMMGVQVTSGKRKLETAATAGGDLSPAKTGRWEPPVGGGSEVLAGTGPTEDCIARLQAVAVPGDAWRPSPTATPGPQSNMTTTASVTNVTPPSPTETTSPGQNSTTTTPLPIVSTNLNGTNGITLLPEDFDDEDDFDDELSDDMSDERCPVPLRYQQLSSYEYHQPHHHSNHHPPPLPGPQHPHSPGIHHNQQQQQQNPLRPPTGYGNTWHYYAPPQQQKILCEENGKSYLELGAAPVQQPPMRTRCCDGRTRWCNVPCYRQRRLAVLNLSMCKLARYRQCSDPSLRRSVLICNTLRHIEREMEAEGNQTSGPPPPPPPPEPQCYSPSAAFTECTPLTPVTPQQQRLTPVQPVDAYEHNLRDFASSSGRATPFPTAPADGDSGIGDEDCGRAINWGTVLSLTSQTDLEPLNNNEFYAELGLSAPASELEWKEHGGEWDSFMHVLVGGS